MKRLVSIGVVLCGVALLSGCCSVWPDAPWCGGKTADFDGHRAMFLYNGAGIRMMNILSPRLSRAGFEGYVNQMKSDGADTCLLYLINQKDGGWTPYSFYVNDQIGGTVNQAVVDEYNERLKYVLEKGLAVVLVLRPDDSPNFVRTLESDPDVASIDVLSAMGVGEPSASEFESFKTMSGESGEVSDGCGPVVRRRQRQGVVGRSGAGRILQCRAGQSLCCPSEDDDEVADLQPSAAGPV